MASFSTSVGNLLSADADECGSGTTTLTSAKLNLDIEGESIYLTINWDNDWNASGFGDSAIVEVSTNFGCTWQILRAFNFQDVRNSHESIAGYLDVDNVLSIRFRSIQPGWGWWWAIDNVRIELIGPMYIHLPPSLLKASGNDSIAGVNLFWNPGWTFIEPIIGYRIFRKTGLPTNNNLYEFITQTNANTFSYFDESVELGEIYTYKIRTIISTGSASIPGNEATAYVPAIVPVELISFTSAFNNNNVTLTWQTATETNNQGFQIERRKTQVERNEDWKNTGFVNGKGTTTEPQSYSFVDKNLEAGKYQYRLKQIDFDGSFEYSNTIEVEITAPIKFTLEQNYPNPFNPSTNIQYAVSNRQFVTLKVYDLLGKEVATLVNEEKPAGNNDVEFNASQLASGIYYYQLRAGDFVETKKMVLMR